MDEEVDRIVAAVRALEQAERIAADDADRAHLDHATTLGGDGEQLFGLLTGREALDAEFAASASDGQHDAGRQDGAAAGVRQCERPDRAFADDDSRSGEVEGDVVLCTPDEEKRAQDQRERHDDGSEGQLAPAQADTDDPEHEREGHEHPRQRSDDARDLLQTGADARADDRRDVPPSGVTGDLGRCGQRLCGHQAAVRA
ncbi:MAG: hypothetical protein V4703_00335 [Actinomycetota bacterium]